ncbi:MAG: SDR family oxidoreductase [Polyangiales bacterium]
MSPRRIALVTAASKGLGRATAAALARDGHDLVVCARTRESIELSAREIAEETGRFVVPVVADVSVAEDLDRVVATAIDRFGALHVVVSNGGGPRPGTFATLDEAAWRDAIDGTLLSTVRLFRAAIPHLTRAGFGRLIVITSSSVREPIAGLLLSNVTRPALAGLCKTLSKELGAVGITVNNVAPGSFDTERIAHVHQHVAATEGITIAEARRRAERSIPAQRLGDPRELGEVVAFLASDKASYVSGQTILVDGGRSAAL